MFFTGSLAGITANDIEVISDASPGVARSPTAGSWFGLVCA
jgi:hypothetical protein